MFGNETGLARWTWGIETIQKRVSHSNRRSGLRHGKWQCASVGQFKFTMASPPWKISSGSSHEFLSPYLLIYFLHREIDAAFLRRFERKVLIDLPDVNVRQSIIRGLISSASRWTCEQFNTIAQLSDGFSGADIKVACKEATMKQIRAAIKANVSQPQAVDVTFEDFCGALKQIQATMIPLAEKHRIWHHKFGTKIYKMQWLAV